MLSRNRMLIRSLVSSSVPCTRNFSGTAPPPRQVLKTGDTLRQTRIFTNEDVTEYSKASYDSNPLHFDSEFARNAGFEDRLVHGMLVAALFPRIIAFHFCFKNDKLLVIDGEAVAILPNLAAEKVNVAD
ncbi:hypothetical protein D5086_012934 [Populus alba]|uniref:Uncharacterized protein n=1 Tax=Populus alba TaxID=43335 RepID=A0ACC4C5F3_POPAL